MYPSPFGLQATVLCDIIVLNVLKRGPFYKENKYLLVTDDDAFKVREVILVFAQKFIACGNQQTRFHFSEKCFGHLPFAFGFTGDLVLSLLQKFSRLLPCFHIEHFF